ncbi:hypothetical protein [Pseudochryseolinea flava]|uniref:Uncharacterized protein n=1 Tax=Pseudochryseolinea flava TaxID=2059302 RepID=A0A364XY95_9BACT|nr:hypothetical protein [Pseudochryseolinea flava]RAV99227.1 hypothetical protein DQQ10_20220 [Pseudochryseolinea flava]
MELSVYLMPRYAWMLIVVFWFSPDMTLAQRNTTAVDSLVFVRDMPYICDRIPAEVLSVGCGDGIFWRVVSGKQAVISALIDRVSDTTQTNVFVPNFGGHYTVGDVAYVALQEIIHGVPTFDLLGVSFDEKGCGYCVYWNTIRNLKRRLRFQKALRGWHESNRKALVWKESNDFATCDCRGRHPNGGHFEIKGKN